VLKVEEQKPSFANYSFNFLKFLIFFESFFLFLVFN
jgi:hypothetical protein